MREPPLIALIGRPNVGKSTLFNRLVGRRQAITASAPGTTRDRHFGVMNQHDHFWTVVDTAGVPQHDTESPLTPELQENIDAQVEIAIEEAELVALITDVTAGIHPTETWLVKQLRRHSKPTIILANKADNAALDIQAHSFAALGVQDIFPVSAIHNRGISDFANYLLTHYPSPHSIKPAPRPRVAIIGRPNVGKSALLNQIIGRTRAVVSAEAGTTRDVIAATAQLPDGTTLDLIDTAGIQRRGRVTPGAEKYALFRTLRAINQADAVILLLTIEEAPARGDAHAAMYAQESGKAIIVAINKTDLAIEPILRLPAPTRLARAERFLKRFPFLQRLPARFISALNGDGVAEMLQDLVKLLKASSHTPESKRAETVAS